MTSVRPVLVLCLVCAACSAFAQTAPAPRPQIVASPLSAAPTLDGNVVDDQAWAGVVAGGDFRQTTPDEGQPASERTEVRIGFTKDTLYIGVVCYDRTPSAIIASEARRDAPLDDSDSFRVILDTFRDQQNGFVFGTNPNALEYDGQVTNEGQGGSIVLGGAQAGSGGGFNLNWDASWTVRTSVSEIGWSAEFAIPFRTLRYPSGDTQEWGINFQRTIRRRNEVAYWSPLPRQFTLFRLSQAGTVAGLEDSGAAQPQTHAVRARPLRACGPHQRRVIGEWGHRRRREVQPHAQHDAGRDGQHGLRAGRGRRVPDQPRPLQPLLPGKAPVLPRKRGLVCRRQPGGGRALLQPAHRHRRAGRGHSDRRRRAGVRAGARAQRRAAQHADRLVRIAGGQQLHRGARAQGSAQPLEHRRHRRQSRWHRVAVGPGRLQPQLRRGRARRHRPVRLRVGLRGADRDAGPRRRCQRRSRCGRSATPPPGC